MHDLPVIKVRNRKRECQIINNDDVITRHTQYPSEPRVTFFLSLLLAFINPPRDLIVAEGSPARFDCEFSTPTSVSISWEKGGATVTPVGRFSYLVNGSLLISPTQAGDNGTYSCVVADQSNQQREERSASLTFACKELLCLGIRVQCTLNPHGTPVSIFIFVACIQLHHIKFLFRLRLYLSQLVCNIQSHKI